MAQPCDPLKECTDLDGKLLLQRAVYGPQLAFDPGSVAVGGVASRGSALRTLLHLKFEARWKATGLCYGPPTSVMGLAPGEVVTIGLRTRSARTFSNLVRDAAEKLRSSSHTTQSGPSTSGGLAGLGDPGGLVGGIVGAVTSGQEAAKGGLGGSVEQAVGQVVANLEKKRQEAEDDLSEAVELVQEFVGKFGSSVQDAMGSVPGLIPAVAGTAGAVAAVSRIAVEAGNGLADLVDNVVGGAAGAGPAEGLLGTLQLISDIIETVEQSESQSSLRETTVTTTTESEQTITRTFANPYLDRSLQLRFIPVFQRFEVSTRPIKGTAALATVVAEPDEPSRPVSNVSAGSSQGALLPLAEALNRAGKRTSLKAVLGAASRAGAEGSLRETMLSSVQKATQASGAAKTVRLDQGLAWDRTTALGNAIHVPLADADTVARAWRLKGAVTQRVQQALKRLSPEAMRQIVPQPVVRVVHVFAGLHVEAVPGSCVLPDIPEHLRVIVPGGTTYAPVK